jgi:hypothetical protein
MDEAKHRVGKRQGSIFAKRQEFKRLGKVIHSYSQWAKEEF